MTNEGTKDFLPDETTRGADHLGVEVGLRTGWSQHGASRARLVAPSNGASNPDHWSAEGISTPGQSRQFGSGALRRTIEIPRWSKPNRTRIPPEYVRREKWFVESGMAARGIASCCNVTVSRWKLIRVIIMAAKARSIVLTRWRPQIISRPRTHRHSRPVYTDFNFVIARFSRSGGRITHVVLRMQLSADFINGLLNGAVPIRRQMRAARRRRGHLQRMRLHLVFRVLHRPHRQGQ